MDDIISRMLKNIRFYVLLISFLYSVVIYFWVTSTFSGEKLQTIRLTQIYSLTALAFLYLAMLIGPLLYVVYSFPFRNQITKARRAIGVSVFYFALLHTYFAFFKQLGGFDGLGFLSNKYLIAIAFSVTSLVILFFLTITSVDKIIAWMKFKNWKLLQRLVYLSSVFTLIHALMLGTHFADLSTTIPQIFILAFAFLWLLEANRIDYFLRNNFRGYPPFGLIFFISSVAVGSILTFTLLPPSSGVSLGIHAAHIQIAKDAQTNNLATNNSSGPLNQAMTGDRTKRFSVSYDHPETIIPNQPVKLSFKVNDASSGNKTVLFNTIYEKKIHLIIVDSSLQYFDHVHPEANADGFSIDYTFPKPGEYHLYADFQPVGAIEQQFAFTQQVGQSQIVQSTDQPDTNLTKQFGEYQVTLDFPKPLQSSKISIGSQKISFSFKDSSGKAVTTLKPYLASFGHLVMINTSTYDYIHVHPTNLTAPKPDQNGGPTVEFLPLGLYGPIKPGIYKVFGQFNPNSSLMVADFVIKID